jgi:hypothetical protein
MASGSYTVGETTMGILAYGAVGALSAFVVDVLLPPVKSDESDMTLLMYGAVGAAATTALTTEAMRMLMPTREDWLPPASDGAALIGAAGGACKTRQRFGALIDRYGSIAREELGLEDMPVPTDEGTAQNGKGNEERTENAEGN